MMRRHTDATPVARTATGTASIADLSPRRRTSNAATHTALTTPPQKSTTQSTRDRSETMMLCWDSVALPCRVKECDGLILQIVTDPLTGRIIDCKLSQAGDSQLEKEI